MTIIWRGFPEDCRADFNPATIARMPRSTATVSAIPSAVMIVVVFRTLRLRKLYESGIAIEAEEIRFNQRLKPRYLALPYMSQRIGDRHARGVVGWDNGT